MYKSCFLPVFTLVLAITLSGCGQRICVAGVGDCSIPGHKDTSTRTGSTKKVTVKAAKTDLVTEESTEITAEGGLNKIAISVIEGVGTLKEAGGMKATFTAPTSVPSSGSYARIKAWDPDRYKDDSDKDAFAIITINIMPK